MADELENFMVEDARLIFKNFEGKEGMYNREGERNFGLVLTQELADQLASDGWNVKVLKAREEGDEDTPWLPVEVKFKFHPPHIVLLTNGGKTRTKLSEKNVQTVDGIEIEKVDLIVRPYHWALQTGATGVKAYLKSMYITVREDALERKYGVVLGTTDDDGSDDND